MIAIKKEFTPVPEALLKNITAFEENKKANKYVKGNYKPVSVKATLCELYNKKCGYCEKSLLDNDKHVEHYRPKVLYFWLAFSWDNLLLACENCNRNKKDTFPTKEKKAIYNAETIETAQGKIQEYDRLEQPSLIHPEQVSEEELKTHFTFELETGKIIGKTDEMKKMIEICQLNREELLEKRRTYLDELKNDLRTDLYSCKKKSEVDKMNVLKLTLNKFKNKIAKEKEFYAWRVFVFSNWRIILKKIQEK